MDATAISARHRRCWLGPGQIEWLQITLDGPPDEHDKRTWTKQSITPLSLVDLDIEELDRRLELAPANAASWGCQDCAVHCPSVCEQFLICEPNVKS